ncbi:hypothetical protein FXO38_29568 [Capsicum annuum]|nr:hypothetical protein FXO38_29568 [Capsicum annuum]
MAITEFVLVSEIIYQGDNFHSCSPQRSFIKVTISIPVRRNSSCDEFVASVMQSGDLDCASSDVVISYLMHSRKKVNPTIINSDVRVLTYLMDVDADGFRPILRINMVKRSFEGPLNSSPPPPRRSTVDDDLNDYENDDNHPINMVLSSVKINFCFSWSLSMCMSCSNTLK